MRSLQAAILLGLALFISCQNYDELLADVCFRKIYVCGDHRWRVTKFTGRLVTEPHQFGEICRKNKEFIACVDDAVSNYCNESMSDLARMTLNNRISLKMFCTDFEWRKSYYSSAPCINENEDKVTEECENEENVFVDDRPWWCLIPEPCDAFQRVFDCSVQKMKRMCGVTAAEVFKRMRNLKVENQDVVCEFRRQNPRYCRYERQKRQIIDPKEQAASSSHINDPSGTEAIYNVVRAVVMDTINNMEEQKEQDFSSMVDSDNLKLRTMPSVENERYSNNNDERDSTLLDRFGFQDNSHLQSDTIEIQHLKKLIEDEQHKFHKSSNVLKAPNSKLKNYILRLIDLMRSEEMIARRLNDDFVETYWRNLKFPVQTMICARVTIASKKIFKCSMKLNIETEEANWSNSAENQNPDDTSNKLDIEMEAETGNDDSVSPTLNLLDIHRYGNVYETSDDDRDAQASKKNIQDTTDLEALESVTEVPLTGFILIESPSSTELSMEPSTESYSELIESTTSNIDSIFQGDLKTSSAEDVTESIQLREIEDAIDERLDIADTNIKSEVSEDHCSLEEPTEDCGNRGSVFTDHSDFDLKDSEEILSRGASDKRNPPSKMKLKTVRRTTTTEDPFYEAIERLAMEEYERRAREKEIESFNSERDAMLARERNEIESFLKEKEILAHERAKRSASYKQSSKDQDLLLY